MYGRLAVVAPRHTEGLAPSVIVGFGLMVIVIGDDVLVQPAVLLRTVMVALYVPAAAAPGTAMTIGLAVNPALVTSAKPAACAVASKSILY